VDAVVNLEQEDIKNLILIQKMQEQEEDIVKPEGSALEMRLNDKIL
jgi:hypothetical protein